MTGLCIVSAIVITGLCIISAIVITGLCIVSAVVVALLRRVIAAIVVAGLRSIAAIRLTCARIIAIAHIVLQLCLQILLLERQIDHCKEQEHTQGDHSIENSRQKCHAVTIITGLCLQGGNRLLCFLQGIPVYLYIARILCLRLRLGLRLGHSLSFRLCCRCGCLRRRIRRHIQIIRDLIAICRLHRDRHRRRSVTADVLSVDANDRCSGIRWHRIQLQPGSPGRYRHLILNRTVIKIR